MSTSWFGASRDSVPTDLSASQRRPGFDYVTIPRTTDEKAVRSEGYCWVQTNTLTPHWVQGVTQATTPENIANRLPDRLNPHGHHGPNTHRIVQGKLTIESVDSRSDGLPRKITISRNGTDPISAPVKGDVVYEGITPLGEGCTFVEGHACLSPTTALRFMQQGTLKWFGVDGQPVPEHEQAYVMEQLRTSQTIRDDQASVSFRMRGRRPVAYEMTAWFQDEWQEIEQLIMVG